MSSTLQFLVAGRKLIENPENWCQIYLAKDSNGEEVTPLDPRACRWCTYGAARKVTNESPYMTGVTPMLDKAANLLSEDEPIGAMTFNDTYHHKEVLAMWDKAIELCANQAQEPAI